MFPWRRGRCHSPGRLTVQGHKLKWFSFHMWMYLVHILEGLRSNILNSSWPLPSYHINTRSRCRADCFISRKEPVKYYDRGRGDRPQKRWNMARVSLGVLGRRPLIGCYRARLFSACQSTLTCMSNLSATLTGTLPRMSTWGSWIPLACRHCWCLLYPICHQSVFPCISTPSLIV